MDSAHLFSKPNVLYYETKHFLKHS